MQVSMDGLRKTLIADYNTLCWKLNMSIKNESHDPEIIIHPDEIKREMDTIRGCIGTLAFCFIEGEDSFNSLPEDTHIEVFYDRE